jgi:hypothetical protein
MDNDTFHLIKPAKYQRANRPLFRTYGALRWHLNNRRSNGLVACGAVVESPLGLLIDESKMPQWLMGRGHTGQDAA